MLKIKEKLYIDNVKRIKHYSNEKNISVYKIVNIKKCLNSNVDKPRNFSDKNSVNDKKLDNNISRAKSRVKELGLCNIWDYFATITLDKKKYDRYNLKQFKTDLSQYIANLNKIYKIKIRYILIPEQHKDGAWHMHGFFSGIPLSFMEQFDLSKPLDKYIVDNYETVMNFPKMAEKFGFVSFDMIRDQEKAVNYLIKYITKDLAKCVNELGAHMYYSSNRLNKAKDIIKGTSTAIDIPFAFENEYCSVLWTKDKTLVNTVYSDIIANNY